MTEQYYAIHEPGKWTDAEVCGVLRRTYKVDRWFDEVYVSGGAWEWSPIYLQKEHRSDHAVRFSVITEGEAGNIIRRLDKPR